MKKELIDTGADIKLHVGAGDPTEMILSVADEEDVSLIAMSAFGLDRISEILLGSTTFTVVRRTKKPVLHHSDRTGKQNRLIACQEPEVVFFQADAPEVQPEYSINSF